MGNRLVIDTWPYARIASIQYHAYAPIPMKRVTPKRPKHPYVEKIALVPHSNFQTDKPIALVTVSISWLRLVASLVVEELRISVGRPNSYDIINELGRNQAHREL